MKRSRIIGFTVCLLLSASPWRVLGREPIEKNRALVLKKLQTLGGPEHQEILRACKAEDWRCKVESIEAAALEHVFPKFAFHSVRFAQYPVGFAPPPPLSASNIFVVSPAQTVSYFSDKTALEQFFRSSAMPTPNPAGARETILAWLRLSQELHQDGMFQFAIPQDSLKITESPAGIVATGKAVVENSGGGNLGEVVATLELDKVGKLLRAREESSLKAGIRPICQATKLLDTDPIVRRMAEQDIHIMGSDAKPYLDYQRTKASPELRAAIDRAWARILADGR